MPALLAVNEEPETFTVIDAPSVSAFRPVPVIVAGGVAAFQSPVNELPVTVSPIVDVPWPRKLTRLPCDEVACPLIGWPLLEIVSLISWRLVSVPVVLVT